MKTPRLPPIAGAAQGAGGPTPASRSVSLSPSQLAQRTASLGAEERTTPRRRAASESGGGRKDGGAGVRQRVVRTLQELEESDMRRRRLQREQADRARRVAMGRRRQQQLLRLKAEEDELSALDVNVRKTVGLGVAFARRIR